MNIEHLTWRSGQLRSAILAVSPFPASWPPLALLITEAEWETQKAFMQCKAVQEVNAQVC